MTAESTLVRLITSVQPRAVALIGGWGRGKTHLWRNLVKTTGAQARDKYSYVSLFGVNSLEDLKLAIWQEEIDAGPPESQPSWWDRARSKLPGRGTVETLSNVGNPWLNNLNALYRKVAFSGVKDRLICFDDFERRGKDLSTREVLGLITFLCDERQCTVVMILNDITMDGIDDWNKHREKVFHSEVIYRPSTETCLSIIYGTDDQCEWLNGAREVLTQLDVSNMRIMVRVKDALAPLAERFPEACQATKRQIGGKLALYIYCYCASGEGAPPIERALTHHRLAFSDNSNEQSEDEKRWDATLRRVNFSPDELDLTVAAYVRDGYPSFEEFAAQVARLNKSNQENSVEQAFSKAWECYHSSFQDNSAEIIEQFSQTFPAAAPTMSALNANSTIALVRALGQEELANSFIEHWIAPRRGKRRAELSLREAQVFGPITDHGFNQALNQAERQETTTPDVNAALDTVAQGQGSIDQSLNTISQSDPDSIVRWMEQNAGRPFRNFVNTSMQYRGGSHVGVAQRKIRVALQTLSDRSPINSIRISKISRELDR